MNKFENVDVLAALNGIVRTNTVYFQNDFDIDKKILLKAAESPEKGPMLWFSRPSGTCCVSEHDVFLKGTHAHKTWKFYGEQTGDKLLAYAVELSGMKSGRLMGNLYELDYGTHWQHVRDTALQPKTIAVTMRMVALESFRWRNWVLLPTGIMALPQRYSMNRITRSAFKSC